MTKYLNREISNDYRGNFEEYNEDKKDYVAPTEEEKSAILNAMNREHSQMYIFEKFLEETKDKNVYIVIPPMSKDFQEFMPDKRTIFGKTYDIVKSYGNVKLLDYYDDNDFKQDDFFDFHHLNLKGAKKFTNKIKNNFN